MEQKRAGPILSKMGGEMGSESSGGPIARGLSPLAPYFNYWLDPRTVYVRLLDS